MVYMCQMGQKVKERGYWYWPYYSNKTKSVKNRLGKVFSKRKPQPQHWYDLSVGNSAYHIGLTANTQKNRLGAEIYVHGDKDLFEKFKSRKDDIEGELGIELEWRIATKDCRILALNTGDIKKDENEWPKYFDWFCEMALRLYEIIGKYGQ